MPNLLCLYKLLDFRVFFKITMFVSLNIDFIVFSPVFYFQFVKGNSSVASKIPKLQYILLHLFYSYECFLRTWRPTVKMSIQ